jgi:hypothetical protein
VTLQLMPNHAPPPIDIWQTLAFLLDEVKKETPPNTTST